MNNISLNEKKNRLILALKNYDSLLVAFSGGVDSSFLLAVSHGVLKDNSVAATAVSAVHPLREKESATAYAKTLGIKHVMLQTEEMNLSDFTANRKDRCYICKKNLFKVLLNIASKMGLKYVVHGANRDDLKDFRPGFKAAKEMGIVAPLIDAGLAKKDIRSLSKEMNLKTWDKPPMACLATRIPYGTAITRKALGVVEQAENVILTLGFRNCRVRHHGEIARIEVDPLDFEKIFNENIKAVIIKKFRNLGFSHISVDMEGYRQGSMNRDL